MYAFFSLFYVCSYGVYVYVCGRFYVGCNVCMEWFHGSCVGVSASNVNNLSSFVCRKCRGRNSKTEAEELHCVCRTPYDESKYGLCIRVLHETGSSKIARDTDHCVLSHRTARSGTDHFSNPCMYCN